MTDNSKEVSIKSAVQDLVKNVTSTGFFEKIKVTATTTGVVIEAMDKDKEVVFKGNINRPITSLVGEFGLSNLSLLAHIVRDPDFNNTESKVLINYESRGGTNVPTELAYQNKSKSQIVYRFMSNQLVPPQPNFIEPAWDVTIVPNKTTVQQFTWAADGLSNYEQYFIPKVVDGDLRFLIGEETSANQRGAVTFSSDVKGKLDSGHRWKIANILNVLKLIDSTDSKLSFSNKGVIQATVNSGVGEYKFIFLAKVK